LCFCPQQGKERELFDGDGLPDTPGSGPSKVYSGGASSGKVKVCDLLRCCAACRQLQAAASLAIGICLQAPFLSTWPNQQRRCN
jgi:hypothetical protein